MLQRILKNFLVLLLGQGVQLLTSLLVPALFVRTYGMQAYGNWLLCSASVSFFATLDFGFSTYVHNALTGAFHQHNRPEFHRLQTAGLWLAILLGAVVLLFASAVWVVDANQILGIDPPLPQVAAILHILLLQIVLLVLITQISGAYRAFDQAHRGALFGSAARLSILVATAVCLSMRTSFLALACFQTVGVALVLAALGVDYRRKFADLAPKLAPFCGRDVRAIIRPSAYFGLFTLNNFVLNQGPIFLLGKFFGPAAAALFNISRSLFAVTRQLLAPFQHSIFPELSRLAARENQNETQAVMRAVSSLASPIAVSMGVALALGAPILFQLWLKHPGMEDQISLALFFLIFAMMNLRDFLMSFLLSANRHRELARVSFCSYSVWLLVSSIAVVAFGKEAQFFLVTWAFVEAGLLCLTEALNKKLFDPLGSHRYVPAVPRHLFLCFLGAFVIATIPRSVFVHNIDPSILIPLTLVAITVGFSVLVTGGFPVLRQALSAYRKRPM